MSSERGAAMLAALCLAMVFAISLTSYVSLCYVSLYASTRNVLASHSFELAEDGIEQALYALNNNDWSVWTLSGNNATVTMTLTADGLVPTDSLPTPLNLGNGSTPQVTITVTNYNAPVSGLVITSQGSLTPANELLPITRTLTYTGPTTGLTTAAAPIFVNAVAATTSRVAFRNAGTVDSYNSNPGAANVYSGYTYSINAVGTTNWTLIGSTANALGTVFTANGTGSGTGTAYTAYNSSLAGFSAVVSSGETSSFFGSSSVRINNAVLHGYVTGYSSAYPGTSNWFSYSSSAELVGSTTSPSTYIDSSRIVTTPVPYQPVFAENTQPLVSQASTLPVAATSGGNVLTNTCTLGSTALGASPVIYTANGISLSGTSTVSIQGPVIIIDYGNISISGTAGIQLTTPQAALQIFSESGSITIGGSGITYSPTIVGAPSTAMFALPKRVAIVGTNNNSFTNVVNFSTNTPFYGVIYFPYLRIDVTSTSPVIYGSIVGESVTFANSPTIHYDVALRTPTPLTSIGDFAFQNMNTPLTVSGITASAQ